MPEKLLVDAQCKRAKPRTGPYRLRDGGGLFLQVLPDGRKYFQFRYTYDKRERLLQIGPYPEITLESARRALSKHRAVLREGKDPVIARKVDRSRQMQMTAESFAAIAAEWLEYYKSTWSATYYQRNEGLIRRILLPRIGGLPIREVDVTALLSALRSAEREGILESARRARALAVQVFAYAISTGRATANPARELAGALKRPEVLHFAALKLSEVGPMLRALKSSALAPVTKAALMMMLYTGLRDASLRGARWREIDIAHALWTIPAGRMKRRQEHSVPLPRQAIQVLESVAPLSERGPDSFVFPGIGKARFLAKNTLRMALHRLGFPDATAHGMRSLLTDALYEAGFRSEAIERQLHHADKNEVRAAYLRSDFRDYRASMMQYWADWCDALRDGRQAPDLRNVVSLRVA